MSRHPYAIRALFFDAAGTLITPAEPVPEVYARVAGRHGFAAPSEAVKTAFARVWQSTPPPLHPEGSPSGDGDCSWWRGLVERIFAEAAPPGVPEPLFDGLFDELYMHYAQPEAWRLFPDVRPALDLLSPHFELHVLSNFDRRLHAILSGLGLAGRFQTVTISSDAGASKPHPRLFHHALKHAGAEAVSSACIGDEREADLLGATAAGMHAFLLNRPATNLTELAEKLAHGDYSCLQPPS